MRLRKWPFSLVQGMLLSEILLKQSLLLYEDYKARRHHHGPPPSPKWAASSRAHTALWSSRAPMPTHRWSWRQLQQTLLLLTSVIPSKCPQDITLLLLKLCYKCHSKDMQSSTDWPPQASPHMWCADKNCPLTGLFRTFQGKQVWEAWVSSAHFWQQTQQSETFQLCQSLVTWPLTRLTVFPMHFHPLSSCCCCVLFFFFKSCRFWSGHLLNTKWLITNEFHNAYSLNANYPCQLLSLSWAQQALVQILPMYVKIPSWGTQCILIYAGLTDLTIWPEPRYRERSFASMLIEPTNKDSCPQRAAWWQAVQKKIWKVFPRSCQRKALWITN